MLRTVGATDATAPERGLVVDMARRKFAVLDKKNFYP